jgi:hypothetical protein
MYSLWLFADCSCCHDTSEATDDEWDFGDTSQGATETLPLPTPAPFQTTSAKWSGLDRSTVTMPSHAVGTELSHLRHPSTSVPAATAARKPRQVRNESRPVSRESSLKIEGSQQASTAAPSIPVQLTRVPSWLDPDLHRQTREQSSTRTTKLPQRAARVPRNRRGSGAAVPMRPHTETSSTGPQSTKMIPGRPDSPVISGVKFAEGGDGGQGERPEAGRLGRKSNKRESFGDYFGNEPASPLPINPNLESLQRSNADLSQYALSDRIGRVGSSNNNLSATPSSGGHTPQLPSPARLNTPPPTNTRI